MATNIGVKKPQRINKRLKVENWKGLFIDLTKALVFGAAGIWDKSFDAWINLAKDFGLDTDDEALAWKLISRSMLRAIYDLLGENRQVLENPKEGKILESIETLMWDTELTIDPGFFENPAQSPLVSDMRVFLVQWLETCGLADQNTANQIIGKLPLYITGALHEEWSKNSDSYQPLMDFFEAPFYQAEVAEKEWIQYRKMLISRADEAVFGGEFRLTQLYIPLCALYYPSPSPEDACATASVFPAGQRSHLEATNIRPIVVDLREHLRSWLDKRDGADAVRIISGGPGSGKSCFAKVFAGDLAASGCQKVLFIPLHEISIGDDVSSAVGQHMRRSQFFSKNPLDREDDLLVIFDGLDELTDVGSVYEKAARDFVEKVERQISCYNKGTRCVRVLFTGRLVVVQSVQGMFKREQVLSLLPFYLEAGERRLYVDENSRLATDKRDIWWEKYSKLKGHAYDGIPAWLKEGSLGDLTAQPLLNYLVALSIGDEAPETYQLSCLNALYDLLIRRVCVRDWEQKRQYRFVKRSNISMEDYLLVLEFIAVAAWHGSGRAATVEEIVAHCDDEENVFIVPWDSFREDAECGAANLLTTFYFKKVEARDARNAPFAFTHKSFREYLTMKHMVRLLEYMRELFEEQDAKPNRNLQPAKNSLDCWRNLCAPTPMDGDLHQFLLDEMQLYPNDTVSKWQAVLCRLIAYVVTEGMPPAKSRPGLSEELRLCGNAETALLAAHSACARATRQCSEVAWGDNPSAASTWLRRLSLTQERYFLGSLLNHIQWQNQSFAGYSLRGANLAGGKIYGRPIYEKPFGIYGGKDLWWLVLEEDDDNQRDLLLSLECVTYREYHHETEPVTWKDCDLRGWLNGAFLEDVCTREDVTRIHELPVHTDDNKIFKTSGGEDTDGDKLFQLSLDEVEKHFGVKEYYKHYDSLVARLNGEPAWWWLRSPGNDLYGAAIVDRNGFILDFGIGVSVSGGAVRPALWLNRKS